MIRLGSHMLIAGINVIIGNDGKYGKDKTGLNKDVADKESQLSVAGADLKDKQECCVDNA